MISDHISDLITATKEQPNSYWKNKTISALSTALAAAKMNEVDADATFPPKRPLGTSTQGTERILNECTCGVARVDPDCTIHGAGRS